MLDNAPDVSEACPPAWASAVTQLTCCVSFKSWNSPRCKDNQTPQQQSGCSYSRAIITRLISRGRLPSNTHHKNRFISSPCSSPALPLPQAPNKSPIHTQTKTQGHSTHKVSGLPLNPSLSLRSASSHLFKNPTRYNSISPLLNTTPCFLAHASRSATVIACVCHGS